RQLAALTVARTCSGRVAPAITEATTGRASSHEKARSRIVCPRDSANWMSASTREVAVVEEFPGGAGAGEAAPLGSGPALPVFAREQPTGEREVGEERQARAFAL